MYRILELRFGWNLAAVSVQKATHNQQETNQHPTCQKTSKFLKFPPHIFQNMPRTQYQHATQQHRHDIPVLDTYYGPKLLFWFNFWTFPCAPHRDGATSLKRWPNRRPFWAEESWLWVATTGTRRAKKISCRFSLNLIKRFLCIDFCFKTELRDVRRRGRKALQSHPRRIFLNLSTCSRHFVQWK